jgi:hypothetical protein
MLDVLSCYIGILYTHMITYTSYIIYYMYMYWVLDIRY